MTPRHFIGALAVAAAAMATSSAPLATAAPSADGPAAGTVCAWGGTPASPSGAFSITPGLTDAPLTRPSDFYVTGALSGGAGCSGTLTYRGQIDAGGDCTTQNFEGLAIGIPGVHRFEGVGVTVLGPARLVDTHGNTVASENAQVATPDNAPHFSDCFTPTGFTGGSFSSVIVFTTDA